MGDQLLVAGLRAGDPNAWEQLFRRWYPVAYRTAYLLTHDAGRAEDAIQEAFCQAIRKIDSLRRPERLQAWLHVIVSRAAIDQLRRNSGRRDVMVADLEDTTVPPAVNGWSRTAGQSPEEAVVSGWEAEAVAAALRSLPPQFRQVIFLFVFNHLAVAEIAAELGCTEGTVKSPLNRGRARLQSMLAPALEDRAHG